jgi:hypothetical protein
MTYKILTDDTRWIIYHSNIRLAADPNARNLHLDPLNDKPPEGSYLVSTKGFSCFGSWGGFLTSLYGTC